MSRGPLYLDSVAVPVTITTGDMLAYVISSVIYGSYLGRQASTLVTAATFNLL